MDGLGSPFPTCRGLCGAPGSIWGDLREEMVRPLGPLLPFGVITFWGDPTHHPRSRAGAKQGAEPPHSSPSRAPHCRVWVESGLGRTPGSRCPPGERLSCESFLVSNKVSFVPYSERPHSPPLARTSPPPPPARPQTAPVGCERCFITERAPSQASPSMDLAGGCTERAEGSRKPGSEQLPRFGSLPLMLPPREAAVYISSHRGYLW